MAATILPGSTQASPKTAGPASSASALIAALDQSTDCVKLIGLAGDLQYINRAGLRMLGATTFAEVAGRSWTELWPGVSAQIVAAASRRAAAGHDGQFRVHSPGAGRSARWWDVRVSAVTGANGAQAGYLCVSRDITDSMSAAEAVEAASSELKHRLKNTYAMIGSLLTTFARGDAGVEAFAESMAGRLAALGRAQSLLLADTRGSTLSTLIPALLAALDNPDCPVTIAAEPDRIDRGEADTIALVLGELAVNCAKHGALRHGGGVDIAAAVVDGLLTVVWIERSRVAVTGHAREGGQGLRLMDRIARTRNGSMTIAWRSDGLTATLSLPRGG